MAAEKETSIAQLLAAKEIVVTCGSGGVGKTTTAAALATMAAVHLGGKVLVLTVDPARRLANAMGLEAFGNVETRVPAEAFAGARGGARARGGFRGGGCGASRGAVGGDARHEAELGRAHPPARARRPDARSHP